MPRWEGPRTPMGGIAVFGHWAWLGSSGDYIIHQAANVNGTFCFHREGND
jgi:hypothetical protein